MKSQATLPESISHIRQAADELDLKTIYYSLKARWKIVLLSAIAGLILGIVIALVKAPQYHAEALIQVKKNNSSAGLMGKLSLFDSALSKASPAAVQSVLIKSRYILNPVIQDLALNIQVKPKSFHLFGGGGSADDVVVNHFVTPRFFFGGTTTNFTLVKTQTQAYLLKDSAGNTVVSGQLNQLEKSKKIPGFEIQVNRLSIPVGQSITLVAEPVSTTVQRLSKELTVADLSSTAAGQSAGGQTGILSVALQWPISKQLPVILNKIITLASAKNIALNAQNASKTLLFLQQQLPIIKSQLAQAEFALNRYREKHQLVDMDQEAKMLLTRMGTEDQALEQLKLNKAILLQSFTVKHPVVIAVNNKIKTIQNRVARLEKKLKNMPATDQVALSLIRTVKIKSQLYTGVLAKVEELSVEKSGTVGEINILNRSSPPLVLPAHKASIVLGLLLLGALLASFIIIARRLMLNTLISADAVEQAIGTTVQGVLPFSDKAYVRIDRTHKKETPLIAKEHGDEPFVEAMRGVRSFVQLSLAGKSSKTLAILGSSPGIGKSMISCNLAYLLAECGARTLLIDTDLRRGKVKKIFHCSDSAGLSDYLNETHALNDVIKKAVDNLDIISSGHHPQRPNELLMKPRFPQMVDSLRKDYDYIVFDTPPILAVSDAALVAKHTGLNLFLVGLGKNTADEIQIAKKRFLSQQIELPYALCNYCCKIAVQEAVGQGYYYNYDYTDNP